MRANSRGFDWYPDSDDNDHCVVLRHQLGIAVYPNCRDDVVIRQQDEYGDEDHFVYVHKDNVPKVVQALLEAAGFETATTYGEPLLPPKAEVEAAKSKPKDRTAAERQRRYRASRRDRGQDDRDMDRDKQSDGDGDVDRGEPHA